MSLFFRQSWQDERLSGLVNTTTALSYKLLEAMWVPDVFIYNEKNNGEIHDVTVPNILLRLDPSGYIIFSQRFVGIKFRSHF